MHEETVISFVTSTPHCIVSPKIVFELGNVCSFTLVGVICELSMVGGPHAVHTQTGFG